MLYSGKCCMQNNKFCALNLSIKLYIDVIKQSHCEVYEEVCHQLCRSCCSFYQHIILTSVTLMSGRMISLIIGSHYHAITFLCNYHLLALHDWLVLLMR